MSLLLGCAGGNQFRYVLELAKDDVFGSSMKMMGVFGLYRLQSAAGM